MCSIRRCGRYSVQSQSAAWRWSGLPVANVATSMQTALAAAVLAASRVQFLRWHRQLLKDVCISRSVVCTTASWSDFKTSKNTDQTC